MDYCNNIKPDVDKADQLMAEAKPPALDSSPAGHCRRRRSNQFRSSPKRRPIQKRPRPLQQQVPFGADHCEYSTAAAITTTAAVMPLQQILPCITDTVQE